MSSTVSPILFRYIGQRFLYNFFAIFGGLLCIIYLIDAIEVIRRLAKFGNFSLLRMLQVTLLKLPEAGLELMPFAVLIAAVFTFWRLTRTSELVVVRATGVSVWQFLLAPFVLAILLAVFKMAALSPVSAIMLANYEEQEAKYFSTSGSTVNIGKTGLWLRQSMDDGKLTIIHAQSIKMPDWILSPVTAFFFTPDNLLTHRIDGEKAVLTHDQWIFTNAWVNTAGETSDGQASKFYAELALPTPIKIQDIERRFASPRVVSFWHLAEYARIMESTGFESNPLWAYFYGLLAEPFLNMALVLLAAALALRAPRMQKGWWLVLATLFTGFAVFFLGDFLQVLGISERLPIVVAAFAPATITLLAGMTALLYLEEG